MSTPNWWGDWRPILTPHTGNLQPTDLLECTMIVGGSPVNTVITGAQILGAVPTPSVAWGSITGTLSAQTDLNTALSGKASTGAVTGTGITMSTARILGRTTAGTGAIEEISIGSGLTLSAGTLTASGGGLTVGTTAIASGTNGRVLFQDAGVLQQDASFFWDNTNKRLGVGATPSANVRLDVRAQGALSSDIAFRVRNSANTANLIESRGNGTHIIGDGTWGITINNTTANHLVNGNIAFGNNIDIRGNITHTNGVSDISFRTTQAPLTNGYALNPYYERFIFGATSTSGWGTGNPSRFIGIINGTAPNGTVANGFALYSAAVTAGNAAPHFRTENGDIVKLYRVGGWGLPTGTFTRTTFNTATVTTEQLAERVAALIQDLRDDHQLLKA